MKSSILPSKSFDKNYLLRLLNGNTEMMGAVLTQINQNIPSCMAEIEFGIQQSDYIRIVTYASRAKSAFSMLREKQTTQAFQHIILAATNKDFFTVKDLFVGLQNEIEDKFNKTNVAA